MHTRIIAQTQLWMTSTILAFTERITAPTDRSPDEGDRGDVPGWVMITVMTAIVVIALLAVFRDQVTTAVKNAFDTVNGAGKT